MPELFWSVLRIGGYLALFLLSLIVALTVAMLGLFGAAVVNVLLDDRRKRKAEDREYRQMCEDALRYADQLYQNRDAV